MNAMQRSQKTEACSLESSCHDNRSARLDDLRSSHRRSRRCRWLTFSVMACVVWTVWCLVYEKPDAKHRGIFFFASAAATVEETDYYEILKVRRDSSQSEIKKAFRKMSMEFHPDRDSSPGATERFSKMAAAYDVLSDPKKRQLYDRYGEAGLEEGVRDDGEPSLFQFFNPFGFGGRASFGHQNRGKEKATASRFPLYVTLDQLYFGDFLQVTFTRPVVCPRAEECIITKKGCVGPGIKVVTQRIGAGLIVQNQIQDDLCVDAQKGWKDQCSACPKGSTELQKIKKTVFIDAGMADGETITLEDSGIQKLTTEPGDVVFRVTQIPHAIFKRKGQDLETTVYLTLLEALVGFKKTFVHISKKPFTHTRDAVTHDGEIDVLEGLGMPAQKLSQSSTPAGYGNLYITYRIKYPVSLSESSKSLIKDALSATTQWKHEAPKPPH